MTQTFKDFLLTEAKKGKKNTVRRMFNPERFRNEIEKVLDQLIKRTASKEDNMLNELVMIEAISVVKEVMADRLMPYLKPGYAERKEKDDEKTADLIYEEIKEVLHLAFPEYKPALNQFMNLIVSPIIDEAKRAGLAKAAKSIDTLRMDSTSQDAFGYLMRYVMNSDAVADVQDAEVAKALLSKWSKDVRTKRKAGKKVKRRQRKNSMNIAIDAILADESVETDEKEDKE